MSEADRHSEVLRIRQLPKHERDAHDLEILNRDADLLNAEALDALEYQAPIEWEHEDD